MVFCWSLSDTNSPQVTSTLHSILVYLNNAVVWMVSARPLISNSSSSFIKSLGIFPSTPIKNGIAVTFVFRSFLCYRERFRYLSLLSFSLVLTLWSARTAKSTIWHVLFYFLLIISRFLVCSYFFFFFLVTWSNFNSCIIPSRSPSPPSHI